MSWKEKFKKYIFSGNLGKIRTALAIKQKNLPRYLYRYRCLREENFGYIQDEIMNANIYLSNPKNFNDPYDSASVLKVENIKKSNSLREKYRESFKSYATDEEVSNIFDDTNWFDKMIAYHVKATLSENNLTADDANVLEEAFIKTVFLNVEQVNEYINSLSKGLSKIVCFTESNTNLPMWNHYADKHSGICLEYDTTKIKSAYVVNRIFPVYYVSELPDGVDLVVENRISVIGASDYLLIHKLKEWRYEKEWRLIFNAGDWYKSLDEIPEKFYEIGKSIDFIRPSKIYIGYKISEDRENLIRKIGETYSIPVVKMQCTNYGLKPEDEI